MTPRIAVRLLHAGAVVGLDALEIHAHQVRRREDCFARSADWASAIVAVSRVELRWCGDGRRFGLLCAGGAQKKQQRVRQGSLRYA